MRNAFLATTSTEGLQPLGSVPQRSYELISDTLGQRLGPEYAALFSEPVASEHGDRIDWYGPAGGTPTPLPELPEAAGQALRLRLGRLIGDIRAEADRLADSDTPGDQRLSEALINAIEVPDEAMIYGVKDGDGHWQPVLVHWAWVGNEQAAVRGVLTGMVPRPGMQGGGAGQGAPVPVSVPATGALGWWWLVLLGWLLLAAMLGAILYLLLAPCGVNRFGLMFCPTAPLAQDDAFAEERVISDENARLRRELALADRACQPVVPILPALPSVVPPVAPPVFPVPQEDQTKRDVDRTEVAEVAEVKDRIADRGATLGALNFVLEWSSLDDIDLYVTCPSGQTISFANRSDCGGHYDLDANVAEISAITDPVENIVFENPAQGLYKVRAHLRSNRTGGDKTVTLHVLRRGDQPQSFTGVLGPGRDVWTTNISISR